MLRKFLIVFSAAALLAFNLNAQVERPSSCTAFLPATIDKGLIHDVDAESVAKSPYGQNTRPAHKTYWHAYSDRANNKTYSTPSTSGKQYSSLAFNDKVTIAAIKNGFALVIQDEKQDFWPNVSSKAVVRGWIPMSNLLLWTSCPTNEYGIYHKAVICANGSAANIKNSQNVRGKKFLNPAEAAVGRLKTDMSFYFVMKTEGNMALLANDYKLSGDSKVQLYGWADASSYIHWNQRTCLEPTWAIGDAEYFADNKITAKVYDNKGNKVVDIPYRKSSKAKSELDPYMYRMDPYLLRYPILDGSTDARFHCTAFANPATGIAPVDVAGPGPQYAKLNAVIENRKKVKIAIVIDGTTSMQEYYEPVRAAIVEGVKYFSGYTVQVGAVIYRDKEDGEFAAETFLPSDITNPNFEAFMKGGRYGIKSSRNDKDMQEALYYGINTALDKFNFNPEESNIMLVVGDCGDNGKMGIKAEDLISKMIAKHVSFMGFQVRNKYDNAFQSFNDQLTEIMRAVIQGRYDKDRSALSAAEQKQMNVRVKPQEVRGGINMTNNSGANIYLGLYRNAETGKDMPGGELSSLLENSVAEWKMSIATLNDQLRQMEQGDIIFETDPNGKVNENMLVNKAAMIEMLGKETFDALSRNNALVGFDGYASKTEAKSGKESRSFFKPVVFMSDDELGFLIEKLAPLYNVARKRSNSRIEYVDALRGLVKSIVPGISAQEASRMKYEDVMRLLAGLPVRTGAMGYSIEDILDPDVVKHGEYLSIVNNIVTKYNKLSKTKGSKYQYSRQFGDVVYYWLPIEDLP